MRFARTLILALAICPLAPDVAPAQNEDGFNDAPPRRVVRRQRRTWRNSPIVWGLAATVLVVAIPIGIVKTIAQMRQWRRDQERDRPAWERAQADFERERDK